MRKTLDMVSNILHQMVNLLYNSYEKFNGSDTMEILRIKGGNKLSGTVEIGGAKNSAVAASMENAVVTGYATE